MAPLPLPFGFTSSSSLAVPYSQLGFTGLGLRWCWCLLCWLGFGLPLACPLFPVSLPENLSHPVPHPFLAPPHRVPRLKAPGALAEAAAAAACGTVCARGVVEGARLISLITDGGSAEPGVRRCDHQACTRCHDPTENAGQQRVDFGAAGPWQAEVGLGAVSCVACTAPGFAGMCCWMWTCVVHVCVLGGVAVEGTGKTAARA